MSPRMKLPCSSLTASRITTAAEFSSFRCAPATGTPRGLRIFPETRPASVLADRLKQKGRNNTATENAARKQLSGVCLETVLVEVDRLDTCRSYSECLKVKNDNMAYA